MQNETHEPQTYSHGDAVDTGQYGAIRRASSSPQDHERVFAEFRERLRAYLRELEAGE